MEELLLLASPFVVNLLVSGMNSVQSIQLAQNKKKLLRLGVALFSIVLMGASVVAGGELNLVSLEALVKVVLIGFASQGTYFLNKKIKAENE